MASATLGMTFRHLRDLFGAGTVVGLTDGQLLSRYSSVKDEAAFEALVARHAPMVLATCRAVLKCEHDVEDAFQSTFLVLAAKAHAVRGGDALGGWLHRVAYRAAVQANVAAKRRRSKEAEASTMTSLDRFGPGRDPDHDLRSMLHQEIDRLPESLRLTVVLCDLEGLSYGQAARQLQLTVPTLRCRLARARSRLKDRLNRVGFASPSLAVLLPPGGPSTAVPAALIRSTVHAATGGPVSVGVTILTHSILRGMLMTKLKFVMAAGLAVVVVASAGVLVASGKGPESGKPTMTSKSAAADVVKDHPVADALLETVEVKGRVVAPDGRPVAGAAVTGFYVTRDAAPWPRTTSGADGRFSIRLPMPHRSVLEAGYTPLYSWYTAHFPWLVASAPGYGIGWREQAFALTGLPSRLSHSSRRARQLKGES